MEILKSREEKMLEQDKLRAEQDKLRAEKYFSILIQHNINLD